MSAIDSSTTPNTVGTRPLTDVSGATSLLNTVVDGGYCIGCGICASATGSPFEIKFDEFGNYQAYLNTSEDVKATDYDVRDVCPFSETALNEDEIGERLFAEKAAYDPHIGFHLSSYTGYVEEEPFRPLGSSGGLGKWILYELLRKGLVDAVIQVEEQSPDDGLTPLYSYTVHHEPDEILNGSRSVYYPVELSGALEYIRTHPGRYAVTGIPCFVKGLRLLALKETLFRERIAFCVGLVCGHLKSSRYADMLAWQFGIAPGELQSIDFRTKLPGAAAKEKGVTVRTSAPDADQPAPEIVQNLYGADYNLGFFQYKACNFCDDVVGETADVSVGDAWLPQYISDGRGTSIVVVRNPIIQTLLQEAQSEGRLHLEEVGPEVIVASQAGGFRQRREGLSFRLQVADASGEWRPPKRVQAGQFRISRRRKTIYRLRSEMAEKSHSAFLNAVRKEEFDVFRQEMEPLVADYRSQYKPTLLQRIKNGTLRRVRGLSRWFGSRPIRDIEK